MASSLLAWPAFAEGSFPGANGRIVYECERSLCTSELDRSDEVRVTDNPAEGPVTDQSPSWSPDGETILFTRAVRHPGGEATFDLFTLRRDGSGLRQLTTSGDYWESAWSPDGREIAARHRHSLAVMDADGDRFREIAPHGLDPVWSPDGAWIVYKRVVTYPCPRAGSRRNGCRPSDEELWVVRPDGRDDRRLGARPQPRIPRPSWSPDGRELAFSAGDVYAIRPDGTGLRQIAPYGFWPMWSPDGRVIVFFRPGSGGMLVNPDGTGERVAPGGVRIGDWQPLRLGPPLVAPVPRCRVPSLRGATVARARSRLARSDCRLGRVRRVRARRGRRGRVLRQSPAAGRELPAGARVHVVVPR